MISDRVVLGADGCRGGWVVVEWTPGTSNLRADRLNDLARPIECVRRGRVGALAIDMPMGLLDDRPRRCDIEARAHLGARRSSVFPAPVRATLAAADYADACDRSRAACGKALSKQAFNLLPKIAELDRLIEPSDQARIVEAHPELAFTRMAGRPLEDPKRTAAGRTHRRRLLAEVHPEFDRLIAATTDLPLVDLLDAAALAVTAGHVVAGTERRLGTGRDVDRRGVEACIVY